MQRALQLSDYAIVTRPNEALRRALRAVAAVVAVLGVSAMLLAGSAYGVAATAAGTDLPWSAQV